MQLLLEKLALAYREAKTKITVYVGLAIAAVAQAAEHAEDAVNQFPAIKALLPASKALDHGAHWALTGLGILAAFTRIRRALFPPKGATS